MALRGETPAERLDQARGVVDGSQQDDGPRSIDQQCFHVRGAAAASPMLPRRSRLQNSCVRSGGQVRLCRSAAGAGAPSRARYTSFFPHGTRRPAAPLNTGCPHIAHLPIGATAGAG
jgi:hypothetical protein